MGVKATNNPSTNVRTVLFHSITTVNNSTIVHSTNTSITVSGFQCKRGDHSIKESVVHKEFNTMNTGTNDSVMSG